MEVTQDGTLTGGGVFVGLERKQVLLDQMTKILLFQANLNLQRFQLVLHKGQVVASILTSPSYPGDLTLDGLELVFHNLRNVITFLLQDDRSV